MTPDENITGNNPTPAKPAVKATTEEEKKTPAAKKPVVDNDDDDAVEETPTPHPTQAEADAIRAGVVGETAPDNDKK